jgi:hypothetical protein
MAGTRKHAAHRINLNTAATAAGTAANPAIWNYDGYPNFSTVANTGLTYDGTIEVVTECILVLGTTLTGQATNFTSFRLSHYSSAGGTAKNQISVAYSAAGVTTTAFTPVTLAVASGATVPGAGTGTLTVAQGAALPGWQLLPGDSIALDTAVTGTGQYTGALAVTFLIQPRGA